MTKAEGVHFKDKWIKPPQLDIDEIEMMPERKMLCAILDTAINDAITTASPEWKEKKKKKSYSEEVRFVKTAREWFVSDEEDEWSFIWVCHELDINPNDVLKLLKLYR